MPNARREYRKGMFLEGGAYPAVYKRLPRDLEHFEETVRAAGPLLRSPRNSPRLSCACRKRPSGLKNFARWRARRAANERPRVRVARKAGTFSEPAWYRFARVPHLQLTPPIDHAVVVEGLACTSHLDSDRTRFRPWCFPILPWQKTFPPLLYKHSEPAATIDELSYDHHGQLKIRAQVDQPLARRCNAFSVAAKVNRYTLHNENSPDYFAVIEEGELIEISLTAMPSNSAAQVLHRYRALPVSAYLKTLGEQTTRMIRGVSLVHAEQLVQMSRQPRSQQSSRSQASVPPDRAPCVDRPVTPVVRRTSTGFANLVRQMEINHAQSH